MAEHPIVKYIDEAKKVGMSTEEILKELTNAGWRAHEIFEVVLEHRPTVMAPLTAKPSEVAAAPSDAIISVSGISKHYDKLKALDNVSLYVKKGGVTALLGPNGAGKTTLVKILTTLLPQTSGKASVLGYDVLRDPQAIRASIGLAGQYAAVDEILTGRENLEMVGRLYHFSKKQAKERAMELLKQFELDDAADRTVKTYSGGMRRRLDLAASLVTKPNILFLDEPTTGLDPHSRYTMWNVIQELVEGGTTVMLTTQYLEEADRLADYIFVIDHGRIIAQGTSDELKRQTGGDVLELHLTNHSESARAAEIVKPLGDGAPHVEKSGGIVTMPVSGGARILTDAVRLLDEAKLKISDIILRRPSLDDVFLKLTGHSAENGK